MDPLKLLRDIAGTLIGLAPSPLHGIGVFALADIPAGTADLFSPAAGDWPGLPLAAIEGLPAHARKLIGTYCLKDEEKVYLPPHGFKIVDLVLFLNHSGAPNLRQMGGGDHFVTLRAIQAGEELTVDYETLTTDDPAESRRGHDDERTGGVE